jgi:hypothetical protein
LILFARENGPLYVKHIDDLHGYGCFAGRDIQQGECIIKEEPLVHVQAIANKVSMKEKPKE